MPVETMMVCVEMNTNRVFRLIQGALLAAAAAAAAFG
jgi:hypothetical protein